jgi:hypothetical protein
MVERRGRLGDAVEALAALSNPTEPEYVTFGDRESRRRQFALVPLTPAVRLNALRVAGALPTVALPSRGAGSRAALCPRAPRRPLGSELLAAAEAGQGCRDWG